MSAISPNLPHIQTTSTFIPVERGKPVGSIPYVRVAPSRQPSPRSETLFAMPMEPEDARLTGGTRSLERRLLALNLAKPERFGFRQPETLSA